MKKAHASAFLALVNTAKTRIVEIDVLALNVKLGANHPLYLLDVRETSEVLQSGLIPTALHLPKGIVERDIERVITDFSAEIIVYCSGGFRSCLVVDNLRQMGYQQAASLLGGYHAWLQMSVALKGSL